MVQYAVYTQYRIILYIRAYMYYMYFFIQNVSNSIKSQGYQLPRKRPVKQTFYFQFEMNVL